MGVIEILFDEDGEPITAVGKEGDLEAAKQPVAEVSSSYSDDGRASPYYTASLRSIDEEYNKVEKSRKPGAKDIKKRKTRQARTWSSALKEQYERGKPGPKSFGK